MAPRAALGLADLDLPHHLPAEARELLVEVARRNDRRFADRFLGLLLSGSAGRGTATGRSDLDVHVVLSDDLAEIPDAARSPELDELPIRLGELQTVPPFGSAGWWFRWSYAWAPTLLDRTGGRIARAARRQATLTDDEADEILVAHSRLDGWINFAYRALKSDRAGRRTEGRLDAAESVPWLLDVVFAIEGRVRPYNTYLPWELRTHPLQRWPAGDLLPLLARLLDGDPAAVREAFAAVSAAVAAHDRRRGNDRLRHVVSGWDGVLDLFG